MRKQTRIWLSGVCATFSVAAVQASNAACIHAIDQIGVAICGDPEAEKADEALNAAYQAALAQLSPASQAVLRSSERTFLHYVTVKCDPSSSDVKSDEILYPSHGISHCIASEFRDHASSFQNSVFTYTGHKFYTASTYRARAVYLPAYKNVSERFNVTQRVDLIQIDDPKDSAERIWNIAARNQVMHSIAESRNWTDLPKDKNSFEKDDFDDVVVVMSLIGSSPDLISTTITESTFSYHSAHPQEWSNQATTWSLKLGRPLQDTDIFDDTRPWLEHLQDLVKANLKPLNPGSYKDPTIRDVGNVRRWQFRADGLHVVYSENELGGYLSAAESALPWDQIKPYMNRQLAFSPESIVSVSVSGANSCAWGLGRDSWL